MAIFHGLFILFIVMCGNLRNQSRFSFMLQSYELVEKIYKVQKDGIEKFNESAVVSSTETIETRSCSESKQLVS